MLVDLSGRLAGAAEREEQRPQPLHQVGGVFPRRDQDCVRIGRQDDQSLGFGCAASSQIAPPWPNLTPAGLSGRRAGAAEREDRRPQQLGHVGGVFPGRDQDRVGIGRQDRDRATRSGSGPGRDDQSLGSGQLVSQRSFDVPSYHTAIRLAAAVAEQIQHEVS